LLISSFGLLSKIKTGADTQPLISPEHLSDARTISRHAPDLAEQVEKGKRSPRFNTVSQYLAELRKLEEAGPDH
jgi:hypothetical protein